jgi:hypothetical protein
MPFFIERKDTMKTSELTGAALDWAVAKLEGAELYISYGAACRVGGWIDYSTDWSQGGPIIEREGIRIVKVAPTVWGAVYSSGDIGREHFATTPLIATMRCYVASKLGDEIDLPRELT